MEEHTLGSKIGGSSSFSLSVPSEHPDIRNWFSSYKYESFVLDICNGFGDCEKTSRETQGNLYSNGSLDCKNSSKGLHSSDTPLDLSEPPDIRNWFPSYVYESPQFGTNDNLKGFVSDESECEGDAFVIRGSDKEQEGISASFRETENSNEVDIDEKLCKNGSINCNCLPRDGKHESQSLRKFFDSLHSPSQLSETPDIRNWFSSYKYESPVLGTSHDFEDFLSKDSEFEKDGFVIEESDSEDGQNFGIIRKVRRRGKVDGKLHSNEFVGNNCSVGVKKQGESENKDIDGAAGKENLSDQNIYCPEKVFEQRTAEETLQSHCISSVNNLDESSLNDVDSLRNDVEAFPKEAGFYSFNTSTSSCENDRKSLQLLICWSDFTDDRLDSKAQTEGVSNAPAGGNLLSTQVRIAPLKKSTHAINNKENEGKLTSEDGFITTKDKKVTRTDKENSSTRPQKTLSGSLGKKATVSSDDEKEVAEKRKALSERSNVQHPDPVQVTGKWRCPQKNKPKVGPPLKQLRLERWVHRM